MYNGPPQPQMNGQFQQQQQPPPQGFRPPLPQQQPPGGGGGGGSNGDLTAQMGKMALRGGGPPPLPMGGPNGTPPPPLQFRPSGAPPPMMGMKQPQGTPPPPPPPHLNKGYPQQQSSSSLQSQNTPPLGNRPPPPPFNPATPSSSSSNTPPPPSQFRPQSSFTNGPPPPPPPQNINGMMPPNGQPPFLPQQQSQPHLAAGTPPLQRPPPFNPASQFSPQNQPPSSFPPAPGASTPPLQQRPSFAGMPPPPGAIQSQMQQLNGGMPPLPPPGANIAGGGMARPGPGFGSPGLVPQMSNPGLVPSFGGGVPNQQQQPGGGGGGFQNRPPLPPGSSNFPPPSGFGQPPAGAMGGMSGMGAPLQAPTFGDPQQQPQQGMPYPQQPYPQQPGAAPPPPGAHRPSVSSDPNRSRIDPNQIPSPVTVQALDQETNDNEAAKNHPFSSMSKTAPPLASSHYKSIDEGSSGPRFVRMTTYSIPVSEELLHLSALPMAMLVQPFAEPGVGEMGVPLVQLPDVPGPAPLVNHGQSRQQNGSVPTNTMVPAGPIRCDRCKGYINPFCKFVDGGRKFVCSLCQFDNPVAPEYFCNLDMHGQRLDIHQRPELLFGTVDWIATKDYYSRPPKPASYFIAIDVSWNALQSGMLHTMCLAVRDLLYGTPSTECPDAGKGLPPGCRVGIMTYDRSVHFYNLKSNLEYAQMMVVPDIDEMFVPLSEGLLVDPKESRHVIESLLNSLPKLFEGSRFNDPAMGAAVEAAYAAMKDHGGKLLIFQTKLPTIGPGALKNREDLKLLGTDKERQLYEPQEYFWKKNGENLCAAGVCVDMFLFPTAYIDIATIGTLSSLTGGSIYSYTSFDPFKEGTRLKNDIHRSLTHNFAYEALLRVRCSNGLKVAEHFGNFFMSNVTDVEIAGLDSSTTLAVSLRHDGKLEEKTDSVIQIAMLYTSAIGERRIRLHTVSLANTSLLANVFRNAEMDSTINYLSKAAVAQAAASSLKQVREQLTDKCVRILTSYRKNVAASTSPGQLILPESFKLYPIYSLGLLKNKAFRAGSDTSDSRVYSMRLLKSINVTDSIPLIYPKMVPLHTLSPEEGVFSEVLGRFVLPASVRVSIERLESNGIYLVENGQSMMMWVGRAVPQTLLRDIFNVDTVEQIDIKMHALPALPNPTSAKIGNIIKFMQTERSRYPQLQIVRQQLASDAFLEAEFSNTFMMEDGKSADSMSYVDYLCFVHR